MPDATSASAMPAAFETAAPGTAAAAPAPLAADAFFVATDAPLLDRYRGVRGLTAHLADGLAPEDCVVQTMEDVSPTKWHLAHTTWFWETFVLAEHVPGYRAFHPRYAFLFNSYYVQAGERHCRDRRGYLSRPTVAEVLDYRAYVDAAMERLLGDDARAEVIRGLLEVGLNHEQQHQELMLTDLKHVFAVNPLRPVYREAAPLASGDVPPLSWIGVEGGIYEVGHDGDAFSFDNEGPRHRVLVPDFEIGSRLVTCGEWLDFIADGGYRRPELWLSLGWAEVQAKGLAEPFYWEPAVDVGGDGARANRQITTLSGLRDLDPDAPVCNVSYFEADAYARWAGARLPTEFEWETAAALVPVDGHFVEGGHLHPVPARGAAGDLVQMYGDVWQWTRSSYDPYPGYAPAPGALGEYNGKFMCGQYVLRGASCATSRSHARRTYRNFFPPDAAWQFTGLRLARDV